LKGTRLNQIYTCSYSTGVMAFASAISSQMAMTKKVGGKIFAKLSYFDSSDECISRAGIDTFSDISFVKDGTIKHTPRSSETINMKTANLTRPQTFETVILKIQTDFEPTPVDHKFFILSQRDFPSGNESFNFIIGNDYFERINKRIALTTV